MRRIHRAAFNLTQFEGWVKTQSTGSRIPGVLGVGIGSRCRGVGVGVCVGVSVYMRR